jgi:transcriptional regulator with XRE-family HTH domain
MTPGQLIRTVRRRRGLTQSELAARAGTSQPVVSAYEHGRRDPTMSTLAKLIAAAGEELRLDAARPLADLPAPRDPQEHARRFLDVLSLADAIPARRRPTKLDAPRLVST